MTDRNHVSQIIGDLEGFLRQERRFPVDLSREEFGILLKYSVARMFSPVVSIKPSQDLLAVARVKGNFMPTFADRMIGASRTHKGEGSVSFSVSAAEVATLKSDIENQMELTDHPLVIETKHVIDSIIEKNPLLQR